MSGRLLPLVFATTLAFAVSAARSPTAAQTHGPARDAAAATEPFVHDRWTVADGLPVNSVTALLQSRDGYLWIATFDGLARFDGVRFTVFSAANSPELPSSRITDLLETRDGALWLGTEQKQLVRFRAGVFTHFGAARGVANGVYALLEDSRGRLWIGTDTGLGFIEGERFVPVAAGAIRGHVSAIRERRDGSIWIGLADGRLMHVTGDAATERGRATESILALHEDPSGTLWIGTTAGIWRYRDALERFLAREAYGFRSSPRTGELWTLASGEVRRMGAQGLVPVVTPAPGIYRPQRLVPDADGRMLYSAGAELHREGRRIYTLPQDAGRRSQLQTITAILPDREGSIWLGTFGAGLHRVKPALFSVYGEPEGLSGRTAYSVYEDRAGTLWIGTIGAGTYRLAGGRVIPLSEAAGFPATVRSILQDRRGRLWLGGYGLHVCAPRAENCAPAPAAPVGPAGIHAMHEEPDGTLWFGADTGLFRYIDDGRRWERLDPAGGAPPALVRAFLRTRDGALWMGTNGAGLARYQDGRFRRLTMDHGLPIDLIRSLHQDAQGWLWIGTEGRGLVRLDPTEWAGDRRGRLVTYRMADGLFDEVIHQILEDDSGHFWMSTNRGIFRVARQELIDFADGRIPRINSTGYTEQDGLRNREANGGSQPAGIKSRDGRLWFPTQDGVAAVDPRLARRNQVAPNVVIEQITAGGTALRPADDVLALGVEQRDLEIEYTALSFLGPANVRFRYRLEPYDREWVDAGDRRTAFYTGVPPGRYTFRVLASNNDGVWNQEGAAVELQLEPRVYETRTFRVLALLAIVLLIGAGFGWRVRRLRARTLELARQVDERTAELRARERQLEQQAERLQELDRAKSHFFANVSHEFRTPLTLILGPLRDLGDGRRGALPAWLREQHEMMLRNAQRLLRLVNQVLDLAKLESGALTLSTEPRDLAELALTATRSFSPLAERRDIALRFHPPAHPLPVELDAEQIEKVLLNLLSNAFKFTEAGGAVDVTVAAGDREAVVEVKDTGIGIAAGKLPHVFERFYQADSSATRRHDGTGIGLSLVRELVELHGGSVSAQSEPGVGSRFTVRLPLATSPVRGPAPGGDHSPELAGAAMEAEDALVPRGEPGAASGPTAGAIAAAAASGAEAEDRTTVLVVEDNADVRAYVRSVLEPGYRVLEAADGEEGLNRARALLPDLVLADVMMPRLDGFGLARALRDDPTTDCIPIILLTARAGEHAEIEGLGSGADDYLAKPFHAGVLRARVENLIASRRRLRERFRLEGLPAPADPIESEPARPRSAFEERLRAIIEANLIDAEFNTEALAAAAGLSYQQLYRQLANELGAAPSHFLRMVRVERAAQLLKDGAGSVTEVAYSVGFNSLSYFHRCYRERFGSSPLASTRASR